MSLSHSQELLSTAQHIKNRVGTPGRTPVASVLLPLASLSGSPTSIFFSSKGFLWTIIHTHILLKLSTQGEVMLEVGKRGCQGDVSGPIGDALFNFGFWLSGICEDPSGNIFFSDPMNHSIKCLTHTEDMIVKKAGDGTVGFRDGIASEARFSHPTALVISSTGALFVSDTGNNYIRLIMNGNVTTVCGNGRIGNMDGQLNGATLGFVSAIVYTPQGQLLISDASNSTIRRISQEKVTTITSAQKGFQDGPIESSQFSNPAGLAISSLGDILVCDIGNKAIRIIGGGMTSTLYSLPEKLPPSDPLANFNPCGVAIGYSHKIYVASSQGIILLALDSQEEIVSPLSLEWLRPTISDPSMDQRGLAFSPPISPSLSPKGTPSPQVFKSYQESITTAPKILQPVPKLAAGSNPLVLQNGFAQVEQKAPIALKPSSSSTKIFDFGAKEMVPCIQSMNIPNASNLKQVQHDLRILVKRTSLLLYKVSSVISEDRCLCDQELVNLTKQLMILIQDLTSMALNPTILNPVRYQQILQKCKEYSIQFDSIITISYQNVA